MEQGSSTRHAGFDLNGRVAVVTGACGKLGPIWARGLLAAGARVAALDLAGVAPCPPLDDLLSRHDGRAFLASADVLDRGSLEAARADIIARFGRIDILVNNAGIDSPPTPPGETPSTYRLEDLPFEVYEPIVRVNLLGLFQTTQVFLPELRRSTVGSIINISSIYGHISPDTRLYDHIPADPPFLKPAMYGASKAGVDSLTRYLSTHLAGDGIRVNSLVPGGVLGAQDDEFKRKFCARVPLSRMATADDLVGPLVFLASDAASYVTGQALLVDGGLATW